MASVHAAAHVVSASLADGACIAAVNGPENTVISGPETAVAATLRRLQDAGVAGQRLTVSHAFHSGLLDPMLEGLERAARALTLRLPQLPVIGNVTGREHRDFSPDYWRRHARQPVLFAAGLAQLQALGCNAFLEIGPHPVLSGLGGQILTGGLFIPSLSRTASPWDTLTRGLAQLYAAGATVDWAAFDQPWPRRKVAVPAYPFQRRRFWLDPAKLPAPAQACAIEWRLDRNASARVAGSDGFVHVGAHLDFLDAAARAAFDTAAVQLTETAFLRPLMLDEPCVVSAVIEDGAFRITRQAGDAAATVHVEGGIGVPADASEQWQDPDAWRSRCTTPIDRAVFYGVIERRGFRPGAAVRWIEAVWQGGREALARLRPGAATGGDFACGLHPGALEACAQLVYAALPPTETGLFILAGWTRARLTGRRPDGDLWAHARITSTSGPDEIIAELTLANGFGAPILTATGSRFRRVAAAPGCRTQPRGDWLYEPAWQPAAAMSVAATAWTILLLPDRGGFADALAAAIEAAGGRAIRVDDVRQMPQASSRAAVVDCGALDDRSATDQAGRLLLLVQALAMEPRRLVVVTQGARAAASGPEALSDRCRCVAARASR